MMIELWIANLDLTFFILLILFLAIAIDLIFGELPTKIHPVVYIGKVIDYFSNCFIRFKNIVSGFVLTTVVLIIVLLVSLVIGLLTSFNIYLFIIILAILLSSTFSIKMLFSSAEGIKNDLDKGIDVARKSMSYLVSRDTKKLSENLIISATIETLSENITDSVIAPIFYYLLFATFIVILGVIFGNTSYFDSFYYWVIILLILIAITYRIVNTLDAMVGYKNKKFKFIGYFPAKLDDILNFIPARFAGIMTVLASIICNYNWKNSYYIMKRDSRNCPSPNSGFTMAAVAGALDISLVKKGVYIIGANNQNTENFENFEGSFEREDITKAIYLSKIAVLIAISFLILIYLIIFYLFSCIFFF